MNISDVRIINSETMMAANVKPLAMKHHAVPIVVTSTAASAGPKIREPGHHRRVQRGGVRDLVRFDELGHEARAGPGCRTR